MCSVACRNYCQFHLSLYGSSNSVLFVLNSLEMHVIYIYVCVCVCVCSFVAFPDLLVAGDITNWYQS
jgi:hypothetical protein